MNKAMLKLKYILLLLLLTSCTEFTEIGVARTATCAGSGPTCRVELTNGKRYIIYGELVLSGDRICECSGLCSYKLWVCREDFAR